VKIKSANARQNAERKMVCENKRMFEYTFDIRISSPQKISFWKIKENLRPKSNLRTNRRSRSYED
jgi:hypothetical protein